MSSPTNAVNTVHGQMPVDGFAIRSWQFHTGGDVGLDLTPASNSTLIMVSFAGRLQKRSSQAETVLQAGDFIVEPTPSPGGNWWAHGSGRHRGMMVELSAQMIEKLRQSMPESRERRFCSEGRIAKMPMAVMTLTQQLSSPPAHAACLPLWFHAKVMELASFTLFAPEKTAKAMPETAGRERMERAMFLLERDLENPPTLEMLAAEVGCGAFHLSRLFGKITGVTIPEFLRQKRMERAALLLRTTDQSVSEIALNVGYESFSAFTRGFVRVHGLTPSRFRSKDGE